MSRLFNELVEFNDLLERTEWEVELDFLELYTDDETLAKVDANDELIKSVLF